MTLTEIIDKGSITFKKNANKFLIEYSNYNKYGKLKSRKFEARNIQLAYMKLEEFLKYSS